MLKLLGNAFICQLSAICVVACELFVLATSLLLRWVPYLGPRVHKNGAARVTFETSWNLLPVLRIVTYWACCVRVTGCPIFSTVQ